VKWGKDFIVAFGSDLAQNAPERALKVGKAIGTNAANMVVETGANIHDAAVLGFEVATGVDTGIGLRSSVAQMSGEAIASGDPLAHLDVTRSVALNTAANVVTFGVYGTAKEQYGALKDYSEGKASIEEVEDRLANAAGGAVVNAAVSAAFLKATTGNAWGPNIPGLKNVPGPKVVVESVTQLGARARGAMAEGLDSILGRSTPSRGAQLRAKYGERFGEYTRYRSQGYSPRAANRLTQPYEGMGHHYIQQGPINRLIRTVGRDSMTGRALTWFRDSPLNVRNPGGMSKGRFYEFHARMHGGRAFGGRTAQGNRLLPGEPWKATNVSPPLKPVGYSGYLWYGSPDAARLGAAALGVGAAAESRELSRRYEE